MTKGDVTFYSVVLLPNGRKGFVTGITYHGHEVVGISVKTPQGKPTMYKPSEIRVIRY